MARYMASRIIEGVYTYKYVMDRRPDLQEGIDQYLIEQGYEHLIPKPELLK